MLIGRLAAYDDGTYGTACRARLASIDDGAGSTARASRSPRDAIDITYDVTLPAAVANAAPCELLDRVPRRRDARPGAGLVQEDPRRDLAVRNFGEVDVAVVVEAQRGRAGRRQQRQERARRATPSLAARRCARRGARWGCPARRCAAETRRR